MKASRLSFTLLCLFLAAVLAGCGTVQRKPPSESPAKRFIDDDGFLVTWRAPLSPESDLTVELHSMATIPNQSGEATISVAFSAAMPDEQKLAADTPPWRIVLVDSKGATREIAVGRRQGGAPHEFTASSGGALASLPPDARKLVVELNVGESAQDAERGVRVEVPIKDIPRYDAVQVDTTWQHSSY